MSYSPARHCATHVHPANKIIMHTVSAHGNQAMRRTLSASISPCAAQARDIGKRNDEQWNSVPSQTF